MQILWRLKSELPREAVGSAVSSRVGGIRLARLCSAFGLARPHLTSVASILSLWSHVRIPCILLDGWLTELSSILKLAADSEEFASWSQKYQTCLILSSRPREANFSPKLPRTREKTAEHTASRGSLLSSFLTLCGGLGRLKLGAYYHNLKLFCETPNF